MTDLSDLRNRIRDIFSQKLHIDPPAEEADLLESGILDSLTFVNLLFYLEQDFGVRISLENLEIKDLSSIASIAALVAAESA